MGDRASIKLRFENADDGREQAIYLYSHWDGRDVLDTLFAALNRRERWDDSAYLARIIANELFAPHLGEETGYGLSPYELDREYPLLVVDLQTQSVSNDEEYAESFEDFISTPMTDERKRSIMP